MLLPIIAVEIRREPDVVLARQRGRQIARLLGFDRQDQVRIATAVSEVARNAYQYAGGGRIEFGVDDSTPARLVARITDKGAGIANLKQILDGQYSSSTGMGVGIVGARRLMDEFDIASTPGEGTRVRLVKHLPKRAQQVSAAVITKLATDLAAQVPQDPFEEVQRQNQELLATLGELQRRSEELSRLNSELEDTNRGVVALYAELDEKADFLRRASELKTRFLSNMTHEFRTPLNSILSLSQMLMERLDGELTTEQERQVLYIRRAATDLSELVNDLLDLAKVEAGKIVVRPSDFEATDLFGALRGMLRPLLAHNASVELILDEPTGVPTLHTDESKVSQILRNFISNALKYTEHGEVRVSARMDGPDHIVFSVADTGIGIAEEDQQRIFEEFSQVDVPQQRKHKGTGLGLPLSKKLAELLGGRIELHSEPGVGSTFSVTLPISYAGPHEIAEIPPMDRRIDPTRRPVLVVDDNPETLFVYGKYLKGTGFQIVPARSLREASAALREFRPFAIVLDILLQNENSWGLLQDLKRRGETRDIPVFVVTMVENRHKALALGADDFHEKPVDRDWLVSRLKSRIRGRATDHLLIIDDDEVARYVLRGLLSDTRFEIAEAKGGEEGWAMAQTLKPAAIFLDLAMPDIGGFEVLNRLKSNPETRDIPVIVVTSRILTDSDRSLLQDRTVAVLSKDHSARELSLGRVRQALALAGLGEMVETAADHV